MRSRLVVNRADDGRQLYVDPDEDDEPGALEHNGNGAGAGYPRLQAPPRRSEAATPAQVTYLNRVRLRLHLLEASP